MDELTLAHGDSPAGDSAHGIRRSTAFGQVQRLHILTESHRFAQLYQHDVIVNGGRLKLGVTNDKLRKDGLLAILIHRNVVFTQTNLYTANREREKKRKCGH